MRAVATQAKAHPPRRPFAGYYLTKSPPDPHLHSLESHPQPTNTRYRHHPDVGLQVPAQLAPASGP